MKEMIFLEIGLIIVLAILITLVIFLIGFHLNKLHKLRPEEMMLIIIFITVNGIIALVMSARFFIR